MRPTLLTAANSNDQSWFGGIRVAIFIVEKIVDGVLLMDLRGRITLGPETEMVRSKLKELLDAGYHRIIFNLGGVTYVDSVGLGTLISSYISARNAGGNLKLLHLPVGVHQLLQITRLSTVFEIYEDLIGGSKIISIGCPISGRRPRHDILSMPHNSSTLIRT